MLRTKFQDKNQALAVEYFDVNKKRRWGIVVKEGKNKVVVKNILGEITNVPLDKIINSQIVNPNYHSLEYVIHKEDKTEK